jgi:pilus assembly protein TadC
MEFPSLSLEGVYRGIKNKGLISVLYFQFLYLFSVCQLSNKKNNYPIFVRDLTLNVKTGMEPVKAIILLEENDYGALSDDVKLLLLLM